MLDEKYKLEDLENSIKKIEYYLTAKINKKNLTSREYYYYYKKLKMSKMLYENLRDLKNSFKKYDINPVKSFKKCKSYLAAIVKGEINSSDLEKEVADEMWHSISNKENKLLKDLKQSRLKLSLDQKKKCSKICNYTTLKRIAKEKPRNEKEFKAIKGIGKIRYENCGEVFLKVISTYPESKKNEIALENEGLEEIYNKLKTWRNKLAIKEGVPPYIISMNKTLKRIVKKQPKNKNELLNIKGIGLKTYKKYGEEILEILDDEF